MLDGLQLVVDVQLRSHHNETEDIHKPYKCVDDEGVPALVLIVHQGVDTVSEHEWVACIGEVFDSDCIVRASVVLRIAFFVLDADPGELPCQSDLASLCDFPEVKQDAQTCWDKDHVRCLLFIVQEIQKDDNTHACLNEQGSNRDASY